MGRELSGVVSVILTTWNSAAYLRRCLDGIRGQSYPKVEVIHVDNASSDDSARIVAERLPDAKQIVNPDNRGFAAAVNQAIAAASGEMILLCNPDAFLESGYVANLVSALAGAGEWYGMATGKLFRATGHDLAPTTLIDTKGIRMTRSGRHFDIGQGEPDHDDGVREVFGVSGAAAMFTMPFIRDVSVEGEFLDEDFHSYREDADVAWRGRLLGWRALYVPSAVGYHVRRVTPQTRRSLPPVVNMHSVKNRFLLRLKNEGWYLALRNAPFELPRDLVAIGAVLTIERGSLPALSWLWKNRRRIMAKRREIQRRRRVSDRVLASWFR